jgi:hypothetical protein
MNHTGSGYRLEQFLDLRCTLDEFMTPEVVIPIFDQFNESNQQTCKNKLGNKKLGFVLMYIL